MANFSHRHLSALLRLGLALLFAFIGSPAAAYINGIAKVGSLSSSTLTNPVYTPANVSAPTSAVIKVTVSDGAATTSQNITLTVNDTPVVATVTITYYHNDALGSPIAATGPSGNLLWRESYRPYGERLDNQPAGATNPIWYTGKRQDPETGLVYMGARYYNPALGRFLSIDPVGPDENNLHSLNRYAYANNNPYRFTDPDGNIPVETFWDAGNVVYDLGKAAYGAATNNPALVAQGLGDAAADTLAMLILLDNFSLPQMRRAVQITRGRALLEASGNIDLVNVREIAKTGVERISIGALTKHIRAVDLSIRLIKPEGSC